MKYLYKFYIGADNETSTIDSIGVRKYFSNKVAGATFYNALGVWNGKHEESIIVEILGTIEDRFQMITHRNELMRILEQESILLLVSTVEEL